MASDEIALDEHLAQCADFTLIEAVNPSDLQIDYRCVSCGATFREDHWNIEALTYDAFRYSVLIVHPSRYRPVKESGDGNPL